jgi:hypothetical protein
VVVWNGGFRLRVANDDGVGIDWGQDPQSLGGDWGEVNRVAVIA